MANNPFSASAPAAKSDSHQIRRERVKITVYSVLGTMVILCLALLFQGCKNHRPEAENPLTAQQAANPQI